MINNKNKISVGITFIIMIVINALANIIPINGIGTGEVSDSFPNLFAPAAITFSIWGVIYLLLALFVLYYIGIIFNKDSKNKRLLIDIGYIFAISSLANALWIISWHYKQIVISLLLMLVLLISLIRINIKINKEELNRKEKLFVKLPFSIYFGWITVATIANVTALIVSFNKNGFGESEPIWAMITILVGMFIGLITMIKNRDVFYGLVLVWAYSGILLKHLSKTGFNGEYSNIIIVVIISLIIFVMGGIYTLIGKKRYR